MERYFVSCDACSARTLVVVQLNGGGKLQFCQHHFNRHRDALLKIGVIVENSDSPEEANSADNSSSEKKNASAKV